ncbi:hypothetical protein [Reyranella soli]|uniref:Uncharacterized protein n=1 Tax=Reyranella soli TaxID=1230389 RepID=A0A512NTF0_9HYPH|nr:hypothetical protein [Reyranella soli]GEP62201.1 hypothetical protein RSO01_93670 [Reyranella soli]
MHAANDNIVEAKFDALIRRAEAAAAIVQSPVQTSEMQAEAIAELNAVCAELGQILLGTQTENAALTRLLLKLGGRTIRRVVTDAKGNTVLF